MEDIDLDNDVFEEESDQNSNATGTYDKVQVVSALTDRRDVGKNKKLKYIYRTGARMKVNAVDLNKFTTIISRI